MNRSLPMPAECAALLRGALFLDLEVSPEGKVLKVGGVCRDRTFSRVGKISLEHVLQELADLAEAADCVAGHNLVRHDLRILREIAPSHRLLTTPVIDTLVLSPIAFPENPYHRLIKDYRLVRESVNDPVADARQAGVVLEDEFRSLAGLRQTEPALFQLLHYCLATGETPDEPLSTGLGIFFAAVGGTRPSPARALELCRELLKSWGCTSLSIGDTFLGDIDKRFSVAFTAAWLRVAGSNSVLPPWVRKEFPGAAELVRKLRDSCCSDPTCAWCTTIHNPREQLKKFFGFDNFRASPATPDGRSLQEQIVTAGMRDESLLAILPTGGGKSLCFQLPALVRNFRRGVLTIIISPLQALMKDQVDGLVRRTGTPFAAALYGLLTPPERGEVLRGIALGDVALLYVSPEQLRNRSFRDAIARREIGCWVFDEAHCLSKWGHDFRPDYLYAGRFIREFAASQGTAIPPIACFTATAKREVSEEIVEFFKNETGRELVLFEGGVERSNLHFEVQTVSSHEKLERLHAVLTERLGSGQSGHAIVFRATRAETVDSAEFLGAKGWRAAHFHAGLPPSEKKRVQDDFLSGAIQVMCATNAFGMGIDKEDVRLVIHADTPGSLENYLQEAGRAGRDGLAAECVLLYDETDCERQFGMSAFSELSRRDIAQILRALRKAARQREEEAVVITTGEILRDDAVDTSIDQAERNADTKVRTAISWLERAGFLKRDENVTNVFQARLLVRDLADAEQRIQPLNLSSNERELWLAILRELMNAGPADSVTVDRLALLPELSSYARAANANPEYVSGKVIKALGSMTKAGLLKRDMLLNAYVRHRVADHSRLRFDRIVELERKLLDVLATEEPDPEGWMPLSLRLVNQRLTDDGAQSSCELVRALVKSLSEDGRGFAGTHGSLELRFVSRDAYRVRLRRSWSAIEELAEKRRRVASLALDAIIEKIPASTPANADLLVEFAFDELHSRIDQDLFLRSELKDVDAALERALMFLHEQRVMVLQQGLAVFRSAMTIKLQPRTAKDNYQPRHYQPLQHHYRERILQVHVMSEYARRGVERMREALSLVLAYFTMHKEQFVRSYFESRPELLEHATTASSYQRIVTALENPDQIRVVTAPRNTNMLILAGPGSGKTRTVVHRCAYLLRVERVRPQAILICCFNRQAALELRSRLAGLAGDDARGVTVLTYHALAMRLLGRSFSGWSCRNEPELDLHSLIPEAVKLLQGERVPPGVESDEVRDRLLAGFEHILVDEYQDIDESQYAMISAIAGRAAKDADQKLSILAVGDDDQNIYTFRGANVTFIRRFQQDYQAEVHYLVENYRSTQAIIEAANHLIAANADRMKTGHPIRINRHRQNLPAPGGPYGTDTAIPCNVPVIQTPDAIHQARAVRGEIERLIRMGVAASEIAVLSRTHEDLALVRAVTEASGIPVRWYPGNAAIPALHQIREISRFLANLETRRGELVRASTLIAAAAARCTEKPSNPWLRFIVRLTQSWQDESGNAELPAQEAVEFFYENCEDARRSFSYGEGVNLNTVHSAKGTEFDHVLLIGAWPLKAARSAQEEERRAFYVGMTRARHSLTIFDREDIRPSLPSSLSNGPFLRQISGPQCVTTAAPSIPETFPIVHYTTLSLEDLHLGYPAYFNPRRETHSALAALCPGDRLRLRPEGDGAVVLSAPNGVVVARLSRKAAAEWRGRLHQVREARVLAMIERTAEQEPDPVRRKQFRTTRWEIPIVELVHSPDRAPSDRATDKLNPIVAEEG